MTSNRIDIPIPDHPDYSLFNSMWIQYDYQVGIGGEVFITFKLYGDQHRKHFQLIAARTWRLKELFEGRVKLQLLVQGE